VLGHSGGFNAWPTDRFSQDTEPCPGSRVSAAAGFRYSGEE
jgi:hypothetical protein